MTLKQPIHQTEEEREKINVVLTGVWSVHTRGDSYTVSAGYSLTQLGKRFARDCQLVSALITRTLPILITFACFPKQ
jgi:hypothetical protein